MATATATSTPLTFSSRLRALHYEAFPKPGVPCVWLVMPVGAERVFVDPVRWRCSCEHGKRRMTCIHLVQLDRHVVATLAVAADIDRKEVLAAWDATVQRMATTFKYAVLIQEHATEKWRTVASGLGWLDAYTESETLKRSNLYKRVITKKTVTHFYAKVEEV